MLLIHMKVIGIIEDNRKELGGSLTTAARPPETNSYKHFSEAPLSNY